MTPEIEALLSKARDSLSAARLLLEKGHYEISVSRSYYSMFYVAQAFLLSLNLSFSKHSAVIAAFGQKFTKTGKVPQQFHRYLIVGLEQRNEGDYEFMKILSKDDAVEQLSHAQEFVDISKEFFGKPLT